VVAVCAGKDKEVSDRLILTDTALFQENARFTWSLWSAGLF
jgi:hypothetical protein